MDYYDPQTESAVENEQNLVTEETVNATEIFTYWPQKRTGNN